MSKFALFVLALLLPGAVMARVSGRVLAADSVAEPLAGASVSALSLPDSVVVGSALTDGEGRFSLDGIDEKNFSGFLRGQCMGYRTADVPVAPEVEIRLDASSTALNEVVVKASSVRAEAGKYIFTPGDLSNVAQVAWDVLSYTPMLRPTETGLEINGIGRALILVNGFQYEVPFEVLKNYINTFPPGRISKIEIITNPGPRYPNARCVVNVVLKDEFEGVLASVSGKLDYSYERLSPEGTLYVGTSYGKLRVSGYFSGSRTDDYKTSDSWYDFHTLGTSAHNSVADHTRQNFLTGGLKLNYNLTNYDLLGISASVSGAETEITRNTLVESTGANGSLTSQNDGYHSHTPYGTPAFMLRLYYSHTFADNSELEVYGGWNRSRNTTTETYLPDGVAEENLLDAKRQAAMGSAVYTKKFGFGLDLTAGYDLTAFKTEDHKDYNDASQDYFDYTEVSNAVYASLSRKWSSVVSTDIGFRGTFEHRIMRQNVTGESYSQKDFRPVPNVSVAFNLPKSQSLMLEYRATLVKPMLFSLNPLVTKLSENEYVAGNPTLKSYLSHYFSATWKFLNGFTLRTSYSFDKDGYAQMPIAVGDCIYRTFGNVGESRSTSVYLNYWRAFFNNRLVVDADLGWYWKKKTMADGLSNYNLIADSWTIGLSLRGTISEKQKISASLSVLPAPPMKNVGEFSGWDWRMLASVSKTFNFGGRLSLNASNILNTRMNKHFDSDDYSFRLENHGLWTQISLSFSYAFGSRKVRGTYVKESIDYYRMNQQ